MEVQPGLPVVLDNAEALEFPDPPSIPTGTGTNRRLTLAKWMVSSDIHCFREFS